jgi:hypothetical protein
VNIAAEQLSEEIIAELERAISGHGKIRVTHEAYGIIAEEFREFETEVFKNPRKHLEALPNMRKELIQVAAMCMRAILDLGLPTQEAGNDIGGDRHAGRGL